MANEITVSSVLTIRKTSANIDYQSRPPTFRADMTGTKGPVPGAILCSTAGTDIDFSPLTTPGVCRIQNKDATNYVTFGIWDPENVKFFPLGELLPGETFVLRLSRLLNQEFATGTGTTGPDTNTFRIKADTAACEVLIEAFDA